MAFTAQLGTINSKLGNIVLGYGGTIAGTTAFPGVALAEVGEVYDLALGYDPGTGTAQMYGYVLSPGQSWQEQTQLQDLERVIQTASSGINDRDLTRWPKIVQSDWTKGTRQLVFSDASRYYSSDGFIDDSMVNWLTLRPRPTATFYPTNGATNAVPMVSDGDYFYIGLSQPENLLTANEASVETDATGWVADTNCTIAQTAAQAFNGSKSLQVTASSAASMTVTTKTGTNAQSVIGGNTYTAIINARTAVTARTFSAAIRWYDASGSVISTSTAGTATDSNSGWTQATVTVVAPSNAAFAAVVSTITSPANAEVHYIDGAGIMAGTNTTWVLPGTNYNLLIGNSTTITPYSVAGGEILDMINTPLGVFYGTATGLWQVTNAGTATQWTNDGISATAYKALAYLSAAGGGNIYYILANNTHISKVATAQGAGPGTAVSTTGGLEPFYTLLGSTSSGLIFTTANTAGTNVHTQTNIYLSDGTASNITRVEDFWGQPLYSCEVNGTTYLLTVQRQTGSNYNYTLYTVIPSTAVSVASSTIIDDLRTAYSDFQPQIGSLSTFRACIDSDARFVYIAWPGLPTLSLNIVTGGTSQYGAGIGLGAQNLGPHRTVSINSCVVELGVVNGIVTLNVYSGSPTTGTLTESYFDFGTPSLVKYFRSVEIELGQTLPSGASMTVNYRVDASQAWTSITPYQTQTNIMTAYLPQGLKGERIQVQIVMGASASGVAPIVRSVAVKANLARVWQVNLSCRRNQVVRNGTTDQQGYLGKDLLANIQKAYANAGKCFVYIPSPQKVTGAEQVTCVLEDYTWKAVNPGSRSATEYAYDMEGDVDCTLVESL